MVIFLKYWREGLIVGLSLTCYLLYQQAQLSSIEKVNIEEAYRSLAVESEKLRSQERTTTKIITQIEKRPDGTEIITKTENKEKVKEKSVDTAKAEEKSADKKVSVESGSRQAKYQLGLYYDPRLGVKESWRADVGARLGGLPVFGVVGGGPGELFIGLRGEL